MRKKIIIGLPSRNESKTIRQIVTQLDQGLNSLKNSFSFLLVNADCQSTDNTQNLFLNCNTNIPKRAISSSFGKGRAMLDIMKLASQEAADGLLFIDTDLAFIPEEWLKSFLENADQDFDLILPRRKPVWNGGDLTYQLCYPMLLSIWGANIHNPIAGEVFLSRRLVDYCLSLSLPKGCFGYGIDFLIAQAGADCKWCELFLSVPKGNPLRSFSTDSNKTVKIGQKFFDVLDAVVHFSRNRLNLAPPKQMQHLQIGHPSWPFEIVQRNEELELFAVSTQRSLENNIHCLVNLLGDQIVERLHQTIFTKAPYRGISWTIWEDCLIQIIKHYDSEQTSYFEKQMLEQLFLSRVVAHYYEILGDAQWYKTIEQQAFSLYKRRLAFW